MFSRLRSRRRKSNFSLVPCFAVKIAGLWSRNSDLRLRLQAPKCWWLRLQHLEVLGSGSRMILSTENWKSLYCYTTRLPHKLGLQIRNQNFSLQLRIHHLKVFGSGSSHPKFLGLRLHNPDQWQLTRFAQFSYFDYYSTSVFIELSAKSDDDWSPADKLQCLTCHLKQAIAFGTVVSLTQLLTCWYCLQPS